MNFRNFYITIKRHFAAVLFLVISYAGAGAYLWEKYDYLQKQQNELNLAQQSLSEDKVQFERLKSQELEARYKRETELQKRELIADQNAEKNSAAESDIKRRESEYQALLDKLSIERERLSESAERQAAELKLQSLMSEFASLGVNLNSRPCGDEEGTKRYNIAKAKYDEISSWAKAHSLEKNIVTSCFPINDL